MAEPPLIELIDASKTYGAGPNATAAVQAVNLAVRAKEIFGIIGESGAGKSTLIRLINLLERPTSGQVLFEGEDLCTLSPAALRARRRRIGMIFQHFNLLASKTALENVAFPLRLEGGLAPRAIKARSRDLLDRVGLSTHADKHPGELSGGQKQRVGLARALACNPSVLLCDEATSALDPQTSDQMLDLLADLNRDLGLTIVLITHEMEVVRRVCDRVAVLDGGRIVELGEVVEVFLDPQQSITRRLLRDEEPPNPAGEGRTVRLIYRGAVTSAPLLGRIARETGVDYSIHAGRVSSIKGEPYGQLTLSLTGGDVDAALARFAAAGVRVREANS